MNLRLYIVALHAALFGILLAASPAGSGSMTLLGVGKPSAAGGCTEATNYLNRTTALSAPYPAAATTLICGLVTDGTWSQFDAIWLFATQDTTNAILNIVSSSFGITIQSTSGGVTFNAAMGYTTTATAVLNTNFTPSTGGTQFSQNSAAMGLVICTNQTAPGTVFDAGSNDGSNAWQITSDQNTATGFSLNDTTFTQNTNVPGSQGQFAWSRNAASGAGAKKMYGPAQLSTVLDSSTDASITPLSTLPMYIGARNFGSINFPGSRQYAIGWVGSKITSDAQYAQIATRFKQYLTDVGSTCY